MKPKRADCDAPTVTFAVPPNLREYAPEGAAALAIDARTLALSPVDPEAASVESDLDFSPLVGGFPRGRAGVAMALLLGKLDSIALNRPAIEALLDEVEAAGGDPYLTLERLAESDADPPFDVGRRREQIESL